MDRNVIILPLAAFVLSLGFGIPMLLLMYLLLALEGLIKELPERLGTIKTVPEIAFEYTVLMSAFMLVRAFLAGYFGSLSDRVGRKRIIIVGYGLYVVTSYGFVVASSWWDLLFIRVFQGIASAMVWPVAEALLMDTTRWDRRGRVMGIYMMTTNAGFIFGPAFGAFIYKVFVKLFRPSVLDAFRLPFYVLVFMSLISFFLSFLIKEEGARLKLDWVDGGANKSVSMALSVKIDKSIKVMYIMGFANGLSMGFVAPIASLFITHYITSDPLILGSLSTVSGALGLLASYPAGRLSDKIGRKKIIILGQVVTRGSTFYMPFVRSVEELYILYSARAVSFNILSPAFRALQADLVPRHVRGKVFGRIQGFFNLGAAFAPVGGYLYWFLSKFYINIMDLKLPGVAIVFWLSAFFGFISTILFILFVYEPKRSEKIVIAES